MSTAVTLRLVRAPLFWLGVGLLALLLSVLVFSDSVVEIARVSAEYQRRVQFALSVALQDIQSGAGSPAVWTLVTVCFAYGVAHTLGPGHGKAVIVSYFLDSSRPRAWMEGIWAGAWIAFTHTLAALVLVAILKLFTTVGLLGALREVRKVDLVSYVLILLIGSWRLWAGITGRLHEHPGHDHGTHGHAHHGDHHHHDHDGHHHHGHQHDDHHKAPAKRGLAGWLLLTAAGIAPCAGALIIVLLAMALDVLWAGLLGVVAIAVGMALTLSAVGFASMVAHRMIVSDGRSQEIGRFTAIAASLIVIATGATLLLGALHRFFR